MGTYTKTMVLLLSLYSLVSCAGPQYIEKNGYTIKLEKPYAEQWRIEDHMGWAHHSVIKRHKFNPYITTQTRREYLYGDED